MKEESRQPFAQEEILRLSQHRCTWCGHRWMRDSNLYDECGDCHRLHQKIREVLHEVAMSARHASNGDDIYMISGTVYDTVRSVLNDTE